MVVLPAHGQPVGSDVSWCVVDTRPGKSGSSVLAALPAGEPVYLDEQEPTFPNDTLDEAQKIPISYSSPHVIVRGEFPGFVAGYFDIDFFFVKLRPGDVLSMRLYASDVVSSLDPTLTLMREKDSGTNYGQVYRANTYGDFAYSYPGSSPLLTMDKDGGTIHPNTAVVEYVAQHFEDVYIRATTLQGSPKRRYELELRLLRPGPSGASGCDVQTIYLDFDGHTIDTREEFGFGDMATLSPMRAFLEAWGLSGEDEDALIDGVVRRVADRLGEVVGAANDSEVLVRNSRDHDDPGDDATTTRMVIGGTRSEFGVSPTSLLVGVAQSVDPGNFVQDELGVVLLDILASVCTHEQGESSEDPCTLFEHRVSLAQLPHDAGITRLDVVMEGLSNVVSHEIAHMLGVWHTDPSNGSRRLTDAGWSDLPRNLYGVGGDGVMGTPDDERTSLMSDSYDPASPIHNSFEGSTGVQFSDARIASALLNLVDSCSADFTMDGSVDGRDLGLLIAAWGQTGCPFDLNSDARVDVLELEMLLGQWGECP
jgi:hypothetical protein